MNEAAAARSGPSGAWQPAAIARLIALLLPLALLGGALGSQYFGGLHPCEMCYWQRYPHAVAILLAALSFTAPAGAPRSRMLVLLAALAIAVSGAIGVYHAGVEAHVFEGFTQCSALPKAASTAERQDRVPAGHRDAEKAELDLVAADQRRVGDLPQEVGRARRLGQSAARREPLEDVRLDTGVVDADRARGRDPERGEERERARASGSRRGAERDHREREGDHVRIALPPAHLAWVEVAEIFGREGADEECCRKKQRDQPRGRRLLQPARRTRPQRDRVSHYRDFLGAPLPAATAVGAGAARRLSVFSA